LWLAVVFLKKFIERAAENLAEKVFSAKKPRTKNRVKSEQQKSLAK
jgi:hypothetical protein